MVQAKSWSSPPLMDDGFPIFSNKAISALNEIISKSNSDILLTTSHKYRFSLEEWNEIFIKRGIHVNSIERLPRNTNHLTRSEEIQKWFTVNNQIKDFVIIDDDKSLNNLPINLKNRLVLTKPLIGLNESHVSEALRILGSSLKLV